jgi:UDP-2-acetamido-3-amino-2,3-dideoxy-glucuronate N-acetyltransferase
MIHQTAQVHERARIGEGVRIWNWVQVREDVEIGENTILSKGVYVDVGVKIGQNVKVQNNVSIYHGVTIEDGVFVGPHVCFTNDKKPRAINPDGSLKGADDWEVNPILVQRGASLGANATILPGVTIGPFAMVGAGAVVTRDVAAHAIVVGNPARQAGWACECGEKLRRTGETGIDAWYCDRCRKSVAVSGEAS